MDTFYNAALALLLCVAVLALVHVVRGALVMPVYSGKNVRISAVISVRGAADGLDRTVDGLMWLSKNGRMKTDIYILDLGLSPDGEKLAGLVAKKCPRVRIVTADGLQKTLEVSEWTESSTFK